MGLIRPPIRKLEFLALPARRQLPSRFPSPSQPSYLPYLASPSPLSPPFFQPFFPPNRSRERKTTERFQKFFDSFEGVVGTRENFETKVKLNRKEGNPIASCPKLSGPRSAKGLPLYTSPAKGCVRRSGARSGGTVISCPRNRSSRILRRVSCRPVLEPLALKIEYCRGIPLDRPRTAYNNNRSCGESSFGG